MSRSDSTHEDELPRYSAKKLRLIRKWALGISQDQLAEATDCDVRSVSRYENDDSPIPPDFIRVVEKLRVQEQTRRARELGEEEIDWVSLLIPGLELVELVPLRKLAGKLFRMFIALPKEGLSLEGEGPPSPSPEQESGSSLAGSDFPVGSSLAPDPAGLAQAVPLLLTKGHLPEGTVLVENVHAVAVETSESPTRSFSAVRGCVPTPDPVQGQRIAVAQLLQAPMTSKPGRRHVTGFEMAACLACCALISGCLLSQHALDVPMAQEPSRLLETLYTNSATDGNGILARLVSWLEGGLRPHAGTEMSRKPKARRVPHTPLPGQAVSPCQGSETTLYGHCWLKIADTSAPCPLDLFEDGNSCYVPSQDAPKPQPPSETRKLSNPGN